MIGLNILRNGTGRCVLFLTSVVILVFFAGCYRTARIPKQESAPPSAAGSAAETEATREEKTAPVPAQTEYRLPSEEPPSFPPAVSEPVTVPEGAIPESPPDSSPLSAGEPAVEKEGSPGVFLPEETNTPRVEIAGTEVAGEESDGGKAMEEEETGQGATVASVTPPGPPSLPPSPPPPTAADRGSIVIARLPEERAFPQNGPSWARGREELAYKVEFLGLTMGYARFSFLGKVLLSGKEAYHIRVRAWTTGLLSLMFSFDDTIDYYLDVHTMAPLRQEFTRSRKEDDVATFDQKNGTIVYRYKKNGKLRKKVDVVPNVHDPVSVAYYYRSRDPEGVEEGQTMYAGRKLYEVSARPVGFERIRTDRGEFETIVIQPVLRREGKVEEEKKMRMWMTRDERHVPVRLYAKFKKIRTWTLVGELLPDRQGG